VNTLFGTIIWMLTEYFLRLEYLRMNEMTDFFEYLWEQRKEQDSYGFFVRCYETGLKLREKTYKFDKRCYHHVLFKSKFKSEAFNPENVVIIHPDIHEQTHLNDEKTPKIKELKKKLFERLIN
jgi:hypothetical protein